MNIKEQKFYDILKDATDMSKSGIVIDILESVEDVLIGQYWGQAIDIDDINAFGTSMDYVTANGVFVHEIYEQTLKQRSALPGEGADHFAAIHNAEDPVNGSLRSGNFDMRTNISVVNRYYKTYQRTGQVVEVIVYSGIMSILYEKGDKYASAQLTLVKGNVVEVNLESVE
jgi:hypothetical protein